MFPVLAWEWRCPASWSPASWSSTTPWWGTLAPTPAPSRCLVTRTSPEPGRMFIWSMVSLTEEQKGREGGADSSVSTILFQGTGWLYTALLHTGRGHRSGWVPVLQDKIKCLYFPFWEVKILFFQNLLCSYNVALYKKYIAGMIYWYYCRVWCPS